MKIKYLILCFIASVLASCEGIDESNLKLYPSKLYLGVSGYNLQELYDLGEGSLVWDLGVYKSGYYDNAAEVELYYDPTVLTEYQESTQNGLDYEVLPEAVATWGAKQLSLAAEATLVGTQLTFDMADLRTYIPKDEEVKYVYPVRIKSLTEGVEVNTDKNYLLLAIQLHTPQANLRGKGGITEASCDPWRNVNMDKITVPLIMDLPFDNENMELTFTYEADPSLLDEYNNLNNTTYELLPECYTTPALKIAAGEESGTAEIEVDPSTLEPAVGGKEYMLPVRITGCDNPSVKIQDGAVTYLVISMRDKYTGTWTVRMLEKESNMGVTDLAWTGNVRLYMRNAALKARPGDNVFNDGVAQIMDDEAIFFPTWGGTGYEQCSSVVKITDEDYDNTGKKKIEIIYGNIGGIWYDFGTQTFNNSWYDPVNQIIHLEYDGKQSWSDARYCIHREYSNPVFD